MTKSLNALIPKGNNRKKFKMPSILPCHCHRMQPL